MGLKPLGVVKEIVEAAGMSISYVYEDLVFIDHNGFLLQFTDKDNTLLIHINQGAQEAEIDDAVTRVKKEASTRDIVVHDGDYYAVSQQGDENIRLEFVKSE